MDIKFNDFGAQYLAHQKEYDEATLRVLSSGYYILGQEVAEFEKQLALYLGTRAAIGVGNGLEALQLALLALGVGQGDEVITTSHSAVASTLAISAVGATPVFGDIDEYFHLDADKIEALITPKTKVILPVHLYGQSVDLNKIKDICQRHKLFLLEDAAQADGALYQNKFVGTFGEAAAFSFYPTKNLGAFGDGGAVVTSNNDLQEKLIMLRNYGQKNRYEHEVVGINSRLDEIQAAILQVQLKYLSAGNQRRQEIANFYLSALSGIKNIKLPKIREGASHVWHLFVIEAEDRDKLQEHLKSLGIPTLIHYPIPIHKQKCFAQYNNLDLPVLEEKVKKILSLPIHPFLTSAELDYIVSAISKFYN
jgi:dTDP-4-amino-4,6-dideoxygalactose transaminase